MLLKCLFIHFRKATALFNAKYVFTGIQGEAFLIVFMENQDFPFSRDVKVHISTKHEDWSYVNITTSPHLDLAIRSNLDSFVNFTSYVNISVPYNLACQYLKIESKAVIFQTSEHSTIILMDSYYGTTTDGTSIIPTSKLSTEYLVSMIVYERGSWNHGQFAVGSFHSETDLHIKFKMRNNATLMLLGKHYSNGDTFSIFLDKFETFQISLDKDLSGTFITANKPFATFSGNKCVTGSPAGCTHMGSQLPPIQEYDKEYIIPSFYQTDGTLLQIISPNETLINITVEKNTSTLQLKAHEYHNFEISQNQTMIVKSEHPVQITGFAMHNYNYIPFMTVIPGIRHYLNYYKIIVPENDLHNFICVIVPQQSLGNLEIDDLPVNKFTTVFQKLETSSRETYDIRILSILHGVYVLKTTDQVGFGLIVYGHSDSFGYGYTGNFVLP